MAKLTNFFQTTLKKTKHKLHQKKADYVNTGIFGEILVFFVLGVVFSSAIMGYVGYKIGENHGKQNLAPLGKDLQNNPINIKDIQGLYLDNELLKNEKSILVQERDIAINNLNMIREEITKLRSTNNELVDLNETLSKALGNDSPLSITNMTIKALEGDIYAYQFHMMIASSSLKTITAKLLLLDAANFVDITPTPKTYNERGKFSIEGKFIMPKNFTPTQIRLELMIDGQKITENYTWQVNN